jgi:hypothetical protein
MAGLSPFTTLEQTFGLLGAEPHPLAVDGRRLGPGLPARPIPLGELRSIVSHPTTSYDLQIRVLEAVIDNLRQEQAVWVVALGGLLLPGMRRLASHMTPSPRRAPASHQVEAELLSRLLFAARRQPRDTRRFALYLLELARS